jgi:hypothetical protein
MSTVIERGPTHLVRGVVAEHHRFGVVVAVEAPDFWNGARGTVVLSCLEEELRNTLPPIGSSVDAVTLGYVAGGLRLSMLDDHLEMVRRGERGHDSLA